VTLSQPVAAVGGPDPDFDQLGGADFLYLASKQDPEPRAGIFMKGGCDLPTMFVMGPLIREAIRARGKGSCLIFNQGIGISDSRPDILLQTLCNVPEEHVAELVAPLSGTAGGESPGEPGLKLDGEYFRPRLFEPTFSVSGRSAIGDFPKTVVVLSMAPGMIRAAYRHREHGYLVDPGGFWLNESMEKVLADRTRAAWFRANFESIGKMSVADFSHTFRTVIRLVKEMTGAHVLVMNTLVVEPKSPLHNYQFAPKAPTLRRRRFDLALRDLSRELDFHILDVDRVLKCETVEGQVDAGHFPLDKMRPMAAEGFRILTDLGVF
jgi:hypothetical protein